VRADAEGRSLGFPVPDGRGGFDLACTSGAVGKCIRWGYRLWEEEPGGPPLRALHQACLHMTRADYGGDGQATTRDGTVIALCDRAGVRPCRDRMPMEFEAAWGVDGAVCVARPRIPENISLDHWESAIRASRPASAPRPAAGTAQWAKGGHGCSTGRDR
jgi:ADYC domain